MIRELTTRAWLVSAAPPAKLQYFAGAIEGATIFHCDWQLGIPLTHSEAARVKVELEHAFIKSAEKYEVVWLGDVIR